ncbi:hypothetical protein D9613_007402 [Agrocybe pediades]|uniref:DUF427 domain-containing protein n=1 Tax=Agrocybe pediades TaxID=84607 RepID=A0A8H4VJY3_9AGAR|nr:hypothetical protein D9613_007402 [Agrocybe pediades]KAF9555132.1 DUF427-domain-containing protein [Agrocybe pediades]
MATFFPSIPHIEDCPKRIRAYHHGVCLVDTRAAKLVWLDRRFPVYAFIEDDLPTWYMREHSQTEDEARYTIIIGGDYSRLAGAMRCFKTGPLAGLSIIPFDAMEEWFEEDEQVFVHPKDPYKRIDILPSSRHVRIEVNGIEVANTRAPRLLFETGLPVRTYIPKVDCRMDLWKVSDLTTSCPYKGTANYYHIVLSSGETFENVIWWYPTTTPESTMIRGYVAFYDEKVDVWLDGEKQPRHDQMTA